MIAHAWLRSLRIFDDASPLHQPGDERIERIRNKLYKEAYYLVLVICAISILVKSLSPEPSLRSMTTGVILIGVSS